MIRNNMVRNCASVLCAISLACCSIALAQSTGQDQKKEETGKKGGTPGARWEGRVERTSKEQSSLTVRRMDSSIEKACVFDSSTKWVSQYHHEKKVSNIDASQVKEGDYVICKGTEEKSGEIRATVISKRLSRSPQ